MKTLTFTLFAMTPMALFAQAPSMGSGNGFGTILMVLIICIIVFIICRELICWYYKINKMVSNQDEIIRLLKKIANESNSPSNNTKLGEEEKKGVIQELVDSTKFMVTGK